MDARRRDTNGTARHNVAQPATLLAATSLAGATGGISHPLARHQVVAYPLGMITQHDTIPIRRLTGLAFQHLAEPEREPRGKSRLRGHYHFPTHPMRNSNAINARRHQL